MAMKPLQRFNEIIRTRYFWIVVGTLLVSTIFHYATPQTEALPMGELSPTRLGVGRILFILPVALATYGFGRRGGVTTLIIATAIMLVRALFISDNPLDSCAETIGVFVVSYAFVWVIDMQERERTLRANVVEELKVLNAVSVALTQSLDLDKILHDALVQILNMSADDDARGGVFLLDPQKEQLHLRVHHRLEQDSVREMAETLMQECLSDRLLDSRDLVTDDDCVRFAHDTRCNDLLPRSRILIGLKARDRMIGGILLCFSKFYQLRTEDKQLFASIGRHIGVAVENVRLYENLRYYARQITLAQEEERKRIARELHDDTAQGLVSLSRRVDELTLTSENLSANDLRKLEELHDMIEGLLKSVRRFSRDLRPSILDDLGLLPAIESLLDELRESGISAELQVEGEKRRLAPEVELALFRIAQESLSNVRRHSNAPHVQMRVEFGDKNLRLVVTDDGRGFDMSRGMNGATTSGKLGLIGMRERAQILGGTLNIKSEVGQGTTITANLPAGARIG